MKAKIRISSGVSGGGGNFGVVTSFEYRLHELAGVLGGLLIFPFGDAQKLLTFYDEFSASAPDELEYGGGSGNLA